MFVDVERLASSPSRERLDAPRRLVNAPFEARFSTKKSSTSMIEPSSATTEPSSAVFEASSAIFEASPPWLEPARLGRS